MDFPQNILQLQYLNFYTAEGFEEKMAHKSVKTTMPPIDANISLSIVLKFFLEVNVKSIINNCLLVSVVEDKCKRGNDWKCVKEPKMPVRRSINCSFFGIFDVSIIFRCEA